MNGSYCRGEVKCRSEYRSKGASLVTTVRTGEKYGFYKSRECILTVPGKVFAQTVAIYPSVGVNLPIFASEYLQIGQNSFGGVDFHPSGTENTNYGDLLEQFPARTVQFSRHYNLDTWFSPVLWLKKGGMEVRGAFEGEYLARLGAYYALLNANLMIGGAGPDNHGAFNGYMAEHDPARGILKAYFGAEFADDYLRLVLFGQENACGVY